MNKIKARFLEQPDKYRQFIDILYTYKKEQRHVLKGLPPSTKRLSEKQVYSKVAKLLENQQDLLEEFGQFLPDAAINQQDTETKRAKAKKKKTKWTKKIPVANTTTAAAPSAPKPKGPTPTHPSASLKRHILTAGSAKKKKIKLSSSFKHIALAEAEKYGTINEFEFFAKVRQFLKSQDLYDNFLRCLSLYNEEIVSGSEVTQLIAPFLTPELYEWFKNFIGQDETSITSKFGIIPEEGDQNENISDEEEMGIDFSSCKRLGTSYCCLQKNFRVYPKNNGKLTALCKEVLNDVWTSFPTCSLDAPASTSRETEFEECMWHTEDERFELDFLIETNTSTIEKLKAVAVQMCRMSPEELTNFHLDDDLGGHSSIIHQRSVRRLYGEKADDILEALKWQPSVAVPIILRRLKDKEKEWRQSQRKFNKLWRDQVDRFYIKSRNPRSIRSNGKFEYKKTKK